MLIGKQERILGARGKAIEKMRERKQLIKQRLSVGALWKWLKSGPRGLAKRAKRIKNIRKRL